MDDKDFIGQIFLQKCGKNLKVIERTSLKQSGRNPLFRCIFIEDNEEIFCRKDHVLRGTIQNKNSNEEYENKFLNKEWKQNCGYILIPTNKSTKQISNIYAYEGYFKGFEDKGKILFLKSCAQRGNVDNPFLPWKTKESFEKYLIDKGKKMSILDICKDFKTSPSLIGQYIYKFNLFSYISYNVKESNKENLIKKYIESVYSGPIEKYCLKNSQEIDIYLPLLNLGFEFNGNYWHSELFKDKNYHYNKSLQANKEGIKLIHIWEYEWENISNLKIFIKDILSNNKEKIFARNCKISKIDSNIYSEFCNKYHIQGTRGASVKLGLFYNNELVQIMSFGKPRFTDKFEWELIRECSKSNCIILGGKEKLWRYFLQNYNPNNCISYCDFSKFTGNSYERLGFKLDKINLDFVWWEQGTNLVFWRNPYKNKEFSQNCLKLWRCGQKSYIWMKD